MNIIQQRQNQENLNFTNSNENFMNKVIQDYESYNNENPLTMEQFLSELKNEYEKKQQQNNHQYDPTNYFRDSYKHMLNLDQAFDELEQGEIYYNENPVEKQIFSIAKNSPIKIKSKRMPRKQPIISFGQEYEEDFQEIDEQPELQIYQEIEDNRPLQRLKENEYYEVKDRVFQEKKKQQSKLNTQNIPKTVKLLPCQRQTYIKKENRIPTQMLKQNDQIKQLRKYIDSNIYDKHIENIEQQEECNPEEYQMAKKYFSQQLDFLEQLISNNKSHTEKLRKQQIDLNYEISLLEYNKDMLQYQQKQKQVEFDEFKSKENEKIQKKRMLLKLAEKSHATEPNKKYLDKIQELEKQIENLQQDFNKTKEKLEKKKNKYQKYYKDKDQQTKDQQEQIEKLNAQVNDLQQALKSYETNEEVQKLIARQKKDKEEQIKKEELEQKGDNQKENQQIDVKVIERVPLFSLIEDKKLVLSIEDINQKLNLDEFLYDQNQYYKDYRKMRNKKDKLLDKIQRSDGKIIKIFKSGKKEITGMKGFLKEIFPNDYVISHLQNKDIKQELPNGLKIYYYSQNNSTQTTFPQGFNVYYFQNKQLEIVFVDGSKQILYPDGTKKFINYKGEEEVFFKDGVKQTIDFDRVKTLEYPDGNKKIVKLS